MTIKEIVEKSLKEINMNSIRCFEKTKKVTKEFDVGDAVSVKELIDFVKENNISLDAEIHTEYHTDKIFISMEVVEDLTKEEVEERIRNRYDMALFRLVARQAIAEGYKRYSMPKKFYSFFLYKANINAIVEYFESIFRK